MPCQNAATYTTFVGVWASRGHCFKAGRLLIPSLLAGVTAVVARGLDGNCCRRGVPKNCILSLAYTAGQTKRKLQPKLCISLGPQAAHPTHPPLCHSPKLKNPSAVEACNALPHIRRCSINAMSFFRGCPYQKHLISGASIHVERPLHCWAEYFKRLLCVL